MKYLMSIIATALLLVVVSFNSQASSDLSAVHENAGVTCKDCHATDKPTRRGKTKLCKSCHGDVVEIKDFQAEERVGNFHDSPHGKVRCTACHKTHEPSVLYCNECHTFEAELP